MYKQSKSPEEILREIKLRMVYDSNKTLNENVQILEQVNVSGDIRDLRDELKATFNTDEEAVIKILEKYKSKEDFNKLVNAYQEKYNLNLGRDIYLAINLGDKEKNDLIDWAKSIGLKAEVKMDPKTRLDIWQFTDSERKTEPSKTTEKKQISTIPSDLKDVKKFQDWLDQRYGEWAWSPRFGKKYKVESNPLRGYGKYGPSTSKMWNDPEVKNEYLKSLTVKDETPPKPQQDLGAEVQEPKTADEL